MFHIFQKMRHFAQQLIVRRNIRMKLRNGATVRTIDRDSFLILYKTYIRPHLEYCVQSWSPSLLKDIACLEQIQRRATKLVDSLSKVSYSERLNTLGLTTLETRRLRGDN